MKTKMWILYIIFITNLRCASGHLKSYFPENRKDHLNSVVTSLAASPKSSASSSRPLMATVLNEGKSLALIDLATGSKIWQRDGIVISGAPAIGPHGVYFKSGQKIQAISLDTGKNLWAKPIKENYLYGFAFDENNLFVTTGNTNGGAPTTGRMGVIRGFNQKTGKLLWKVTAEKMVGAPAAAGGMVFIPWDRQAISVLNARNGSEICRIIRKDGTLDFVIAVRGEIFYGSAKDIIKLSPENIEPSGDKNYRIEFEVKEMPGTPRIFPDSYMESSYRGGAKERNRLLWSIEHSEKSIKLSQNRLYFVYFKYILGFDSISKLPVWVYMNEATIANSEATQNGIVVLGMDGTLTYVDGKTGSSKTIWRQNIPVQNAFLSVNGFKEPEFDTPMPDLHKGLVDMILDSDTQVVALRKFGMKMLANLPDEKVTLDLVQVMSSADFPKPLRDEAANLLRTRKGGIKYLIDALKIHANFLENQPPPPSGAIASSLAISEEKSVASLLLNHLLDPATPESELTELSDAILKLGDKKLYEPLKGFLLMYHADTSMKQHVDVMTNVAKALIKFGEKEGIKILESISNDPSTPQSLKLNILEIIKEKQKEEETNKNKDRGK